MLTAAILTISALFYCAVKSGTLHGETEAMCTHLGVLRDDGWGLCRGYLQM